MVKSGYLYFWILQADHDQKKVTQVQIEGMRVDLAKDPSLNSKAFAAKASVV